MKNSNIAIMHKVWQSSYSNAVTGRPDIERICEPVYEKFGSFESGADMYNICYASVEKCVNNPAQCNEALVWEKYSEAILQGYTADFETFKKRSQLAGYITNVGQLLQGFFQNKNEAPTQSTNVMPEQKANNTPLIIGGVVLLIGLGAGIYFLTKK